MKNIWKDLKKFTESNRLELLLMLAFLVLFVIIAWPELTKEAVSTNVETQTEADGERGEAFGADDDETADGESGSGDETEDGDTSGAGDRASDGEKSGLEGDAAEGETSGREEEAAGEASGEEDAEDGTERPVLWRPLPERYRIPGFEMEHWMMKQRPEFEELEPILTEMLAAYDGDWSVYVKNLSMEESFVINDRPMKSASVMKIFIMGTVYKAFETGELERTEEVLALVNDMITLSDNEASNELLYRLGGGSYEDGIEKVNLFIDAYGFSDMTIEYNGFNNSATVMDSDHFNQVSARDCGKLLEDIYRRTWVNRSVSNEMEQLLLGQQTRYKIPAGLPEGVLCGNKTGEMDTTENDAAIIYGPDCDYILVVLSNGWSSKDQAISRIQAISSTVYSFLNPSEESRE